jgi:hypothetical protein
VTDDRARRIAVLNAAAKAKSLAKTSAAEQAIRSLVKRGSAVTFQAVCHEAGVSHAFLYGNEELRRRCLLRSGRAGVPFGGEPRFRCG